MENNIQKDFENTKQLKRWFLTINNPFWTENDQEVNVENSTLEIIKDYYNYEAIKENAELFVFKHIEITIKEKVTGEQKQVIVERPYFKNMNCVEHYIENLEHFKGAVFQLEAGENETPHIQAGVIFKYGKRFITMKKYFPTAYIDKARGSNADLITYCTKEKTRIGEVYQIGDMSEQGTRNDLISICNRLENGENLKSIRKEFPTQYLIFKNKLEALRNEIAKETYGSRCRNIETTFYYGVTGVKKTTRVLKTHGMENCFTIDNYGDFAFNNYDQEKVVIFDEFDGQIKPITKMNKMLEPFKLQLNTKGGSAWACFDKVYIISNLNLSQIYTDIQTEKPTQYQAFLRRIHHIIRVDEQGNEHIERKSIFEDIPENEIEFDGLTRRVKQVLQYDRHGNATIIYDLYNPHLAKSQMTILELTDEQKDELPF